MSDFARHTKNVLLVGGPKHGEHVAIPAHQRELVFASLGTTTRYFGEDAPPSEYVPYRDERYREMDGIVGVFEHESLWNANIERAAKRLDAEIDRLKQRHTDAKAMRLEAEHREDSVLKALERAWYKRDKITAMHGI